MCFDGDTQIISNMGINTLTVSQIWVEPKSHTNMNVLQNCTLLNILIYRYDHLSVGEREDIAFKFEFFMLITHVYT